MANNSPALFAGLISIAVTLSLFSVVAWAAIAIAPLPLTWVRAARHLPHWARRRTDVRLCRARLAVDGAVRPGEEAVVGP
jgi:hypothetical protein